MSEKTEIESARFCILMCWVAGIVGGLIVAVLVVKAWDMHALAGLFLGFLATLALAFLFYWLFCDDKKDAEARKANAWVEPTELPQAAELTEEEVTTTAPEIADDSASGDEPSEVAEAAPEPESAAEPSQADTVSEPAATAAPEPDAPEETKSLIQPSKALAGEAELASRKGNWRYGGAPTPAEATEAQASPAANTGEAAKPVAMDGPRAGKADNLKEIKGVGPKLEELLNSLGIYHFDQIAGWSVAEVAWMDDNLKGFKGRVSRDTWVDQARILASGGETEFSKRVGDGDVY